MTATGHMTSVRGARRAPGRIRAATVLAAAGVAAACSARTGSQVHVGWRSGSLLSAPAAVTTQVEGVVPPAGPGQPWVAVGVGHRGESGQVPLWWSSVDGMTWVAGTVRTITGDGPVSGFTGIARTRLDVAAIGQSYSPIHGNARPLMWRLEDGVMTEVPITRELFGGPRTIGVAGITGDGSGFTVAGNYISGGTWLGGPSVAAATAWTSPTGEVWTRLDGAGAPWSGADEIDIVRGVISDGTRDVMFGDAVPLAPGPTAPAIWCATGTGWVRVVRSSLPNVASRSTVLRSGGILGSGGLVLVGIDSDVSGAHAAAVAFVTDDCHRWRRVALGRASGDVTIFDAGPFGRGAVVAWQDGAGLHLTTLAAGTVGALTAPVAGPVGSVRLAGTATTVAVLVTAAGTTRAYAIPVTGP